MKGVMQRFTNFVVIFKRELNFLKFLFLFFFHNLVKFLDFQDS